MSKEAYKKQANEVRNEVWAWDIKAFSNSNVPDSLKNYSYVVLARHHELEASARKRVAYYGLSLSVSREQTLVRTFRERVKLQDKASLETYSSLNYTAYEGKKVSHEEKQEVISVVGVRIIKPDGTVKEVNADETVFTVDEKTKRDGKLAISGLEVGDILDYFIQIYDKDRSKYVGETIPVNLVLADEIPVLHYSVHGIVSKKFAFEHRSSNGAPQLRVTDLGDDWEISAVQNYMPARSVSLWVSPYRQLPILRFNLVPERAIGRSSRQKMGHLNESVTKEDLIHDIQNNLSGLPYNGTHPGSIKDMLKYYSKKYGKIPEDSLAIYVYYADRYWRYFLPYQDEDVLLPVDVSRNRMDLRENVYAISLYQLFTKMGIDAELLLVPSKYGPKENEMLTIGDFDFIVKTNKPANTYFSLKTIFTNPGELPYQYEMQNAFRVLPERRKDDAGSSSKLPAEAVSQNKRLEHLHLSFDGNDLTKANVKRTTTLSGHFRTDVQQQFLLFEDYYYEEYARFGQYDFIEEMEKSKKRKGLAEEYKVAFKKARENLKDVFTQEITTEFGTRPVNVSSWKIIQDGIRHDAPELIYNTEFSVDHITKKAGGNYLLDVGALIGSQLEIKSEQRKRLDDVYMPYARSFAYTIEIDVPAAYRVEGLDKVNMKIDNATGWFESKAVVENSKLIIKVEKGYKKSFVKAVEWPSLVEMLDKATSLKEQKLLLKKA
jgi:hypothetical protein